MQGVSPILSILIIGAFAVLIYELLKDFIDVIKPKPVPQTTYISPNPTNNKVVSVQNEPIAESAPPVINTNDPKWVREHIKIRRAIQNEYNRKLRLDAEIISQVRRIRNVRKKEEQTRLAIKAQEEQSRFIDGLMLWEERQRQEAEKIAIQERAIQAERQRTREERLKKEAEDAHRRHLKYIQEQELREKAEIAERIKEKYRRRQLEKIVRQELIDSGELFGEQPKRPPIPREIVDAVYKRDGGRCVYCGSTQNLQLDHIIPFSKGGATTLENLQLLCQKCNIEKSNKIG